MKVSACLLRHEFPPSFSDSQAIHTNPPHIYYPDQLVTIAYNVRESITHQRTSFTLIYSFLSTPYNVSTNESNNKTGNVRTT